MEGLLLPLALLPCALMKDLFLEGQGHGE